MRALILAERRAPQCPGSLRMGPGALAQVAGKALVIHLVEHLVKQGVVEIEFLTEHLHTDLVEALGEGDRWGITLRIHDVDEAYFPAQLRALAEERPGEPVLLGRADVLPRLVGIQDEAADTPVFLVKGSGDGTSLRSRWTGWAFLPSQVFEEIPEDLWPESVLDLIMGDGFLVGRWDTVDAVLDARHPQGLLDANTAALDGSFPDLLLPAVEVAPGIWFGPRVQVAEDVEFCAPVFLGEEAVVESGCRLGPGCAVGERSVLDQEVRASHAVVFGTTYVGRGLDIQEALVGGDWITSVRHETTVEIQDEILLADLDIPVMTRLRHCLERNFHRARILLTGLQPDLGTRQS